MRTIKFRAWYEQSQTWVYITIGSQLSDVQEAIYSNICINGGAWYQYTGLKDKNGTEIYEGDVVRYNNKHLGEIQYWVGQICVGYRYKSNNVTFALKIGNVIGMEVIGNIHQNKELIKTK